MSRTIGHVYTRVISDVVAVSDFSRIYNNYDVTLNKKLECFFTQLWCFRLKSLMTLYRDETGHSGSYGHYGEKSACILKINYHLVDSTLI